jgi:hypothetical protein
VGNAHQKRSVIVNEMVGNTPLTLKGLHKGNVGKTGNINEAKV